MESFDPLDQLEHLKSADESLKKTTKGWVLIGFYTLLYLLVITLFWLVKSMQLYWLWDLLLIAFLPGTVLIVLMVLLKEEDNFIEGENPLVYGWNIACLLATQFKGLSYWFVMPFFAIFGNVLLHLLITAPVLKLMNVGCTYLGIIDLTMVPLDTLLSLVYAVYYALWCFYQYKCNRVESFSYIMK